MLQCLRVTTVVSLQQSADEMDLIFKAPVKRFPCPLIGVNLCEAYEISVNGVAVTHAALLASVNSISNTSFAKSATT